jgi:hypothetical protein
VAGSCEQDNEPPVSIRDGEFIEKLNDLASYPMGTRRSFPGDKAAGA